MWIFRFLWNTCIHKGAWCVYYKYGRNVSLSESTCMQPHKVTAIDVGLITWMAGSLYLWFYCDRKISARMVVRAYKRRRISGRTLLKRRRKNKQANKQTNKKQNKTKQKQKTKNKKQTKKNLTRDAVIFYESTPHYAFWPLDPRFWNAAITFGIALTPQKLNIF